VEGVLDPGRSQGGGELNHTPGIFLIDKQGQERWYVTTPLQDATWTGRSSATSYPSAFVNSSNPSQARATPPHPKMQGRRIALTAVGVVAHRSVVGGPLSTSVFGHLC